MSRLEQGRLKKAMNDSIDTVRAELEDLIADQRTRLDAFEKRMEAFEEAAKPKKDKKGE